MQNREIAAIFSELADLLEIKGENPFKVRAYRNAARMLESLGKSVEEMVAEGKDLTILPGIGKELSEKIQEIVQTGKLEKLEKLKKEIPQTLRALLSIEGLGPKRVKVLYDTLHISDPDALKEAALHHEISKIPGFGLKTEEKILKGIRLLKQEGVRFLYAEAEPVVEELIAYLQNAPGILTIEAAGSFRRRKETVGDIDMLCTAEEPPKVIDYFTKFPKVLETVSAGTTRSTVVLNNSLQIDLRVVEKESYGAALHYFTGSKSHVIAIRQIAIDLGLKINEYGVYREEKKIAGLTEKDVYKSVGLPVIPPELRENRGEIEAAKRGKLPNLITQEDILGDLHMHTTYSDGMASIEEMVAKAKSKSYRYIAITDHSATLAVVKGLDAKKLRQQLDEIDAFNEKEKNFTILKGMEVDILEDGTLGMDEALLKELDIVLGAIHSKFSLSQKEQTKRLIRAIENPLVNIIAHPTGRLIGKRTALSLNMKEVYRAVVDNGCFMEINSQPERLDLNDSMLKEAKNYGVRFSIATDAHAPIQLDFMKYGIYQARRGWVEKQEVLNTSSLTQLLKHLKR